MPAPEPEPPSAQMLSQVQGAPVSQARANRAGFFLELAKPKRGARPSRRAPDHQRQRFRRGAIVAAQILNIRLERRLSGLHCADDRAGRADRQELALDACARGVKAAEKLIRPGTLIRDLNNAAFAPYVEAGPLRDAGGAHHALQPERSGGRRSARDQAGVRAPRRLRGAGAAADARLFGDLRAPQSEPRPCGRHGGGQNASTSPPTTATGWRRG